MGANSSDFDHITRSITGADQFQKTIRAVSGIDQFQETIRAVSGIDQFQETIRAVSGIDQFQETIRAVSGIDQLRLAPLAHLGMGSLAWRTSMEVSLPGLSWNLDLLRETSRASVAVLNGMSTSDMEQLLGETRAGSVDGEAMLRFLEEVQRDVPGLPPVLLRQVFVNLVWLIVFVWTAAFVINHQDMAKDLSPLVGAAPVVAANGAKKVTDEAWKRVVPNSVG